MAEVAAPPLPGGWTLPALSESRPMRYGVFFYLYLMQGVPAGFALTALANHLAGRGTDPRAIGAFVAAVGTPWVLQFVWGPVIDRYQRSPMGRRRPWVLGSQLLACLASLGLLRVADPATQLGALTAAFMVHSVFASVQDASVDALAIGVIPPDERGRTNAFMRAGMLVGTGVGAAALAYLLRDSGFRTAALAQTGFLALLTALTLLVRERPTDALLPRVRPGGSGGDPGEEVAPIPPAWGAVYLQLVRGVLDRANLRLFGSILAVYLCASVFIRSLSIHLVQRVGWDDTELSVLTGTWGMLVAGVAVVVAGALSDRLGGRRLLVGVMLLIGTYLLAFNLLAPLWATGSVARNGLILWYTIDPAFSIAAMPVLMALCRPGVEGSQFTTYMALVNLSDVVGSALAGFAISRIDAPHIGLLCAMVVLLALAGVRRHAPRTALVQGSAHA